MTLQHLININQIRAQLCRVSQGELEESEFTTQQRQDIEANLCTNIESGIEYMSGVLGEKDMESDLGPSFSPFPKVQGDNIPPTDVEKEDILWNARDHVLNSQNVSMQITWARDVLTWADISHESHTRETEYNDNNRPETPYIERNLRLDAVNIITYLSQQEHPEALYMYSKWLEFGKFGHRLDKREAYVGYKRAAELGHGRSEYRMGMLYEQSNDMLKAKEHYYSGVALDDSASLYRMGMMSLLGQHDETQDYVTGLERIRAAADSSDVDAPQGAYVYGMLIARDLPDFSHLDNNIPEDLLPNDPLKAKMYIEKSAYLGFAKAQLKMGQAYEHCELGCDFHPGYSIHYYGLAAKQGEPDAAVGVSRWFLFGYEGSFEKNESLAYKYAQQAAAAEFAQGEFALGYYNEIGMHVEKNLEEARKWYQKSADHGNKDAVGRLESLHETEGKTLSTVDEIIPDEKTETAPLASRFPKVTGVNIPPTDDEKGDILKQAGENLSNSDNPAARLTWARDALTWVMIAEKVRCRDPESQLAPDSEQQLKTDALVTIRDLAAQKLPEALYYEGKWFEFGQFGHPVDLEEATRRYRQSAEGGFARAEYRLGRIHQRQPEEWETALEHYEKAQSLDDSAANCHLGLIQLLSSHQEEPDLEKGLVLLQQSADSADEDAPQGAYVYGMAIVRQLKDFAVDESLLPIDQKRAFSYIEKSANLGYAKAQLKMGEVYEYGQLDCPQDIAKTFHYYHLAARRGSAEAASILSYVFGRGVEGVLPQDPELSFKFAQLGTIEDHTGAKYMMGSHYEKGTYVQQDLDKARQWYKLASRYSSVRSRFDYLRETAIERLEYFENQDKLLEDRHPEDVDNHLRNHFRSLGQSSLE
ncbi:hypothetical protein FOMA001_g19539 [Fusarium oxysporum f. sp. matthiolae]|nr:hypothetical protein FOMA001_g19539 [Fusarium oxysporum f. sp. matthiolae]